MADHEMSIVKFIYIRTRLSAFSDFSTGGAIGLMYGGCALDVSAFLCIFAKLNVMPISTIANFVYGLLLIVVLISISLPFFWKEKSAEQIKSELLNLSKDTRKKYNVILAIFYTIWIPIFFMAFAMAKKI
jgi:hypothetical protein